MSVYLCLYMVGNFFFWINHFSKTHLSCNENCLQAHIYLFIMVLFLGKIFFIYYGSRIPNWVSIIKTEEVDLEIKSIAYNIFSFSILMWNLGKENQEWS